VNIKEYHWLVHQPITPLPRYYTICPTTLCLTWTLERVGAWGQTHVSYSVVDNAPRAD